MKTKSGEVSEWLKEHAWKACIRQRIESSNLSLTAIFKKNPLSNQRVFCVSAPSFYLIISSQAVHAGMLHFLEVFMRQRFIYIRVIQTRLRMYLPG